MEPPTKRRKPAPRRSSNGIYYRSRDQWLLRREFDPDSGKRLSEIVAKEGPLPVGAHTWKCKTGGQWQDHTLTVTCSDQ